MSSQRRAPARLSLLLVDLLFWRSLAAPGVPYGPHIIDSEAEGNGVSLLQSTADFWPAPEKAASAPAAAAPPAVPNLPPVIAKALPVIVGKATEAFPKAAEAAAPAVAKMMSDPGSISAETIVEQLTKDVNLSATIQGLLTQPEPEEPPFLVQWTSGRGEFWSNGWSPHLHGPFELDLAWKWQHPEGRFHTLGYGTAIDIEGNIYLTAADGLRKFTPKGQMVWEYKTLPAEVTNAACLADGMIYTSNTHGNIFALSTETGKLLWSTQVSPSVGQDNGFVTVRDGVVVAATDSTYAERNQVVRGLNATDGALLWAFKPDVNVWNFMASFGADGSVLFQDQTGKAYKLSLSSGALLWKQGGFPGSWTDGTATLGNNYVFYTVHNNADHGLTEQFYGPDHPGTLTARDPADGRQLWNVTTPRPPNNAPAVGRIYGYTGFSVVQPMGQQVLRDGPTDIYAYDADSGALNWVFYGPKQKGGHQAADDEGAAERILAGVRYMCLPNPWSAPTIDASGTVFIGNQDGLFFALRDLNRDGIVEGPDEVSSYDTGAAFSGSAGPSLAENRVVVTSCDSLFVFGG